MTIILNPGVGGGIGDTTNLSEGQIPSASATGRLIYSGITIDPGTGRPIFDRSIEVPTSSIDFGDVITLSEGTSTLLDRDNVNEINRSSVRSSFDDSGSDIPTHFKLGAVQNFIVQPVFDTTITTNPFIDQQTSGFDNQINAFIVKADSAMTNVRMRVTDNATGIVLRYFPSKVSWFDGTGGFDFISGDNRLDLIVTGPDTPGVINLGLTPFRFDLGQIIDIELRADSISLLGDVAGKAYLEVDAQIGVDTNLVEFDANNLDVSFPGDVTVASNLLVQGTTTSIDTENLNVEDSYIDLNSGYTGTLDKTGGLVVNCASTGLGDTVTAGAFTAGIASTSNPTVVTDGSGTFSQNQIIQISDTLSNNGVYEVEDHTGTLLTIKGVGTVGTVEDFSRNQFVPETDSAIIVNIIACIIRVNTLGLWEEGTSSVTPIPYTELAKSTPSGANTQIQFNDSGVFGASANLTFDETNNRVTAPSLTVTDDLVVQGTTTNINTEHLNVSDATVYLNNGYTSLTATTSGIVANIQATATNDTVTAAAFTTGVPATSNPNVITDGTATFAQNDIIQISFTTNSKNDGIFEVEDHTGTTLTIRGVGTVATVEDFTQTQFIASTDTAVITKVVLSVIRSGTDGLWEEGTGSTTGIIFTDLSSQVDSVQAGTNINITGTSSDPIVNLNDSVVGSGTNGLLDLRGAQGGNIGGAVSIQGGFGLITPGRVNITAGSTNSIGENVFIKGGDGPTGKSGGVFLSGGTSGDDNGEGGDVTSQAGQGGVLTGDGGDNTIKSGDSEGALPGTIRLQGGEKIGFSVFGDILLQENGGSVGIGTSSPDSSSILDLVSTTKGFLPPVLSDTQRDAVITPANGLSIHNSNTSTPQFFDGINWKKVVFTPTNTLGIIGAVPFVINPGEIEADTNLNWDNVNKRLGIGTTSPNASLEVEGPGGASVGGFPSGTFHVTGDGTVVNSNAVITGHSLFNGNTQLWYLGSTSSSNNDIGVINRQNGSLTFHTNDAERLKISNTGVLSSPGDLDLTTGTGGVFKFNSDAFRAGLDAIEYIEIGHGGGNGFINAVGDGGLDFRFEGNTLATFTDFGHLHLMTDVDQKHTLKIITADNLNDTGIAWENSGGSFTGTIFRTDVGTNRADLVFAAGINADIDLLTEALRIHGSDAEVGKVEIVGDFQISSGNPAANRVLTSDASGNANWVLPSGGGWTDAGTFLILTNINDNVGIGTSSPGNQKLAVRGTSFAATGDGSELIEFRDDRTTTTSAPNYVLAINRQNSTTAALYLGNDGNADAIVAINNRDLRIGKDVSGTFTENMRINSNGDIKLNAYPNTRDDGTPINILGTDASGNLISGPNEVIHIGGNFVDTVDQSISIVSTPQDITFNTNSLIDDIGHTAGSATFTINTDGVYNLIIAPQLAQGSGAATVEFWVEKNGTAIVNSNVQETIAANSESLPLLRWKERFVATDTFKIKWASNSLNSTLDNITSTYSGPNIPSIMLGITHVGS